MNYTEMSNKTEQRIADCYAPLYTRLCKLPGDPNDITEAMMNEVIIAANQTSANLKKLYNEITVNPLSERRLLTL